MDLGLKREEQEIYGEGAKGRRVNPEQSPGGARTIQLDNRLLGLPLSEAMAMPAMRRVRKHRKILIT